MADPTPVDPTAEVIRGIDSLKTQVAELNVRVERAEKAPQSVVVAAPEKFRFTSVIRGLATGRWDGAEKLRDMSVASASGGGYLAPAVHVPEIIDILTAKAQLHAMGVSLIRGVSGKSFTRTRKVSGTSAAYLAENTALGLTAPVYSQTSVTPHLAGAYTAMSRLLVENSDPSAEADVRADLARAAALLQDSTGLFGDGSGSTPTGLFNNSDVNSTSVAAVITLDKILDAISAIEGRNAIIDPSKTAILMHPLLWGVLRKAKGSTNDHYILSNDMSSPTKRSIQGLPVYLSTLMEITTAGTDSAYACAVGDWSQLEHIVWNDVSIETTNTGGDAFVKHQLLVKCVYADDIFVRTPDSFECLTDCYTA